jgi:hypothetical protein
MSHPMLRLYDGFENTSPQLREEVSELQETLATHGYTVQDSGLFDGETERSVKRFQTDHGLDDDGVVGPLTWAALLDTESPDLLGVIPTTYAGDDPSLLKQQLQTQQYQQIIVSAGRKYGIPVYIIAGIGSRESAWGLALKPLGPRGTGDFQKRNNRTPFRTGSLPPDGGGFGRGLMQIDYDAHAFARSELWRDPKENILYGCRVLSDSRDFIQQRTSLEGRTLLRAALAGYNAGPQNAVKALSAGYDIDFYTAGRDYSADVLDRAGWFQVHGWT